MAAEQEAPRLDVSLALGRAMAVTRLCADAIYSGNDTDNAVGESLEEVIVILGEMEAEIDRIQDRAVVLATKLQKVEQPKPAGKKKGRR